MLSLEEILQIYFGLRGPAWDDDGKLINLGDGVHASQGNAEEAYCDLCDVIECLDRLGAPINATKVIDYLDSLEHVEY